MICSASNLDQDSLVRIVFFFQRVTIHGNFADRRFSERFDLDRDNIADLPGIPVLCLRIEVIGTRIVDCEGISVGTPPVIKELDFICTFSSNFHGVFLIDQVFLSRLNFQRHFRTALVYGQYGDEECFLISVIPNSGSRKINPQIPAGCEVRSVDGNGQRLPLVSAIVPIVDTVTCRVAE